MNANPSRMSWIGFPRAVLVTRGTFSRQATATMTRNPAAATKNADAGFSVSDHAMMKPAAAGARMRVPGQIEEFNATALIMNCRSTRCGNIDRRAGWSNASTPPARNAISRTCHMVAWLKSARTASRIIKLAVMVWDTMISRRWSSLSAATPPNRLRKMAGTPLAKPT